MRYLATKCNTRESLHPIHFTKREIEILKHLLEGESSKQIACKLYVAVNTINNHRRNMLSKSKSANTAQLLNYAIKEKLLMPDSFCCYGFENCPLAKSSALEVRVT